MKLKYTFAGFISALLLSLSVVGCSGDGSTVSPSNSSSVKPDQKLPELDSGTERIVYSEGIFSCTVEYSDNSVTQRVSIADSIDARSGMRKNSNGSVTAFADEKFYKISKSEQEEICDSLSENLDLYDEGSFVCGGGEAHFKMTVDGNKANSFTSVRSEMEEECEDMLVMWKRHVSSSSSENQSSSSSVTSEFISSKKYGDENHSCTVEYYDNKLVQILDVKGYATTVAEYVYGQNGKAVVSGEYQYYNLSEAQKDSLCEAMDDVKSIAEEVSFDCGNGSVRYSFSLNQAVLGSMSSVKEDLEDECSSITTNANKEDALSSSSSSVDESVWNPSGSWIFAFDGASATKEEIEKDENTVFYENFVGLAMAEGLDYSLNYAISLDNYSHRELDLYMNQDMTQGSLEFFFRPHENFFDEPRALVGNDGGRLLVYYAADSLVFMMNKPNVFGFVKVPANIKKDWNFVRADWDGNSIYLYLNDELIGSKDIGHGYVASTRSGESQLSVGYKSDCCMEGAGQRSTMFTDADFGPIRVSNVTRSNQ